MHWQDGVSKLLIAGDLDMHDLSDAGPEEASSNSPALSFVFPYCPVFSIEHWRAGEEFRERVVEAKSDAESSSKVWSREWGLHITGVPSVVVEGVIRAKAWSKSVI